MARDEALKVTRLTPTKLGTILVPFQGTDAKLFVVELSRSQFNSFVADGLEAFAKIDREAEFGRMMIDLDRNERVASG